jgi:thiol-disulfide isomerase/thioredoxin
LKDINSKCIKVKGMSMKYINSRASNWLIGKRGRWILFLSLGLAGWSTVVLGKPADEVLTGFKPTGDFLLELDGVVLGAAQVYRSKREVCLLLVAPELPSPLLLNLRQNQVVPVAETAVNRTMAEEVWVADPPLREFEVLERHRDSSQQERFEFTVAGRRAILRPRLPLLGLQGAEAIGQRHPVLPLLAARARMRNPQLGSLQAMEETVRVRVYFASWCRNCDSFMGQVLRLEEELQGSKVTFEYYGLPRPFDGEPVAVAEDVHGVPLADVYVGDEKRGRIGPLDFDDPVAALVYELGGATP